MYQKILENYPINDRSCLIPILQDIQNEYGYLPEDIMSKGSEFVDMPFASVFGVATFYNQFRLSRLGKYVISVYRGTACHVKNSVNVVLKINTYYE